MRREHARNAAALWSCELQGKEQMPVNSSGVAPHIPSAGRYKISDSTAMRKLNMAFLCGQADSLFFTDSLAGNQPDPAEFFAYFAEINRIRYKQEN